MAGVWSSLVETGVYCDSRNSHHFRSFAWRATARSVLRVPTAVPFHSSIDRFHA